MASISYPWHVVRDLFEAPKLGVCSQEKKRTKSEQLLLYSALSNVNALNDEVDNGFLFSPLPYFAQSKLRYHSHTARVEMGGNCM